jgi:hypothetical protein
VNGFKFSPLHKKKDGGGCARAQGIHAVRVSDEAQMSEAFGVPQRPYSRYPI